MSGNGSPGGPRIEFPGGAAYRLELAVAEHERTRGLMYRPMMRPDWGMLFIFEYDEPRSFWMKNTIIALDMVFLDSKGCVDSIVEMAEPNTLNPRRSAGAARYVLELNGSQAKRDGVKVGDCATFKGLEAQHSPY